MKRRRLCVPGAAGLALACASSSARAQHARDALAADYVRNALDRTHATPGGFEHAQAAIRQDGRAITFERA